MAKHPFEFIDLPAGRSSSKPRGNGLTVFGEVGADVNIANVMPDDVMETEVLRAGLSVIHVASGADAVHAG